MKGLGNRVLPEFVQIILQLPVRVKEPGTYRTFGNTQDFADLGMGHPLNMKHRDHGSVFIRQFHHGLVQSSLELGKVRFPHRAARGGEFEELFVVLNARIHVIEAEMKPAAAFLEEIQRHVHRDGMDPGVKGRFAAKAADGLVRLGKNVLEQIVRVLVVRGHVVDEAVEPRRVFDDELVKGAGVAAPGCARRAACLHQISAVPSRRA